MSNESPLAILARIESLHAQFDKQAKEILATLEADRIASEHNCKAMSDATNACLLALNDLERALKPAIGVLTAEQMLEHRQHTAHVSDDPQSVERVVEIANQLNTMLVERGFEVMIDAQLEALWCDYPCDTFGMLNDWSARLGLDEDKLRDIASRLFDELDDESQALVLSDVFACRVREALTEDELAEVVRRNRELPQYRNACASHDFMDANECMLEALACLGLDCDPGSQQDADLMNNAWDLARSRGFAEVEA